MFLSQGLLTWTLLLSVLAGSVSSLQTVNGAVSGSVSLTVDLTLPPLENRLAVWSSTVNGTIVTALGNTVVYNPAYQGRCELFPDLTLRLDKLTLADQGDYTLTVTNTAGGDPVLGTVRLAVYKLIDITPSINATISSPANGSDVSLYCDAPNQTVETYTFYRNNVKVCPQNHVTCNGSNLIFHPIIASDEGNYTCTIQNPINNKTSNPLYLQVVVPVHEVMIHSNTSSLLWVGKDSVSLTCSALGTDVRFSWNLNGAELPSDPRYHLNQDKFNLIISPVEINDNGSFTCIASNQLNNVTSELATLSLAFPVTEVIIQSNTSSTELLWEGIDSVFLNCSAVGTAVHVSWNLNGVPLSQNSRYHLQQNNSILVIRPLDRTDNGSFTCTASNVLNSMISNPIQFNLAWHPEGSIKCSAIGNNQNVQLICSWPGGNPLANINMTFNNDIQSGQNEVVKDVSLNTIGTGEKLICHGFQGGREVACALRLEKPYAADFNNYSTTPVVDGNQATLTVTLTGNTVGINSRALIPEDKILPATFTWFHLNPNPTPVTSGGKFSVMSTPSTSNLTVSTVTESENGTYECRAENLLGNTRFFFIIHVTAGPNPAPSNGLGPGEIAGIVIGVLAGLAIIGIIVFFIIKGKKKKAKAQSVGLNGSGDQIGTTEYAVINRNRTNGGIAETSITDIPQDNKDDVQYAALRFQNQESVKPIIPTVPETEYSTVKNTLQK